jgi:hypothetical protein
VPARAPEALSVSVVEPPALTELAESFADTPDGTPEAESETLPLNPATAATLIVELALPFDEMLCDDGDALRVKDGTATVRWTCVDAVSDPFVPVTVTV